MARKQCPSFLDDPPAVSSSVEEEEEHEQEQEQEAAQQSEEEEEEEADSSSEEEEAQQSEKEEAESSSEEEQEQEQATKKPDPPAPKQKNQTHNSLTKPMQPEPTQPRLTRSSATKKRPNSEPETTPSKRVKNKDSEPKSQEEGGGIGIGAGREEKKLFQRVWSDDNEIELLEGMLRYRAIHHANPTEDAASFYDFVKQSLNVEVTKAQLADKMKRLEKKYRNIARRGKKGKEPTFSRPHDRKTFELSKEIWGSAYAYAYAAADSSVPGRCLNGMLRFYKNVRLEESLMKRGLELVDKEKRLQLEERWKMVELAELENLVALTELIRDQARLMLEAYKGH